MTEISSQNIAGLVIYGQQQVDYTVDGVSGQSYGSAIAFASLRRSASVEKAMSALQPAIRARMRKVEELGEVLSYVAVGVAHLATESDFDERYSSSDLAKAYDILNKYGLSCKNYIIVIDLSPLPFRQGQSSKGDLQKLQSDVQYEMDREDNKLQQDMVAMNSYMSKRDQAFSLASSMVRKVNATISKTIQGIH
ncbi:MAG: hypothetical protein IJJ26_12150 [Victivallales bacterium]|nr:hypothetical protein [Victivallales bacterium]